MAFDKAKSYQISNISKINFTGNLNNADEISFIVDKKWDEHEEVLWDEICGSQKKASDEAGYGIYNPNVTLDIPDVSGKANLKLLEDYFSVPREELDKIFLLKQV